VVGTLHAFLFTLPQGLFVKKKHGVVGGTRGGNMTCGASVRKGTLMMTPRHAMRRHAGGEAIGAGVEARGRVHAAQDEAQEDQGAGRGAWRARDGGEGRRPNP